MKKMGKKYIDASGKKCQVWVTPETRQRLRLLAALEGNQLMEQIEVCVELMEQLRQIADAQGTDVTEIVRQLVESVKLPDEDQPKS